MTQIETRQGYLRLSDAMAEALGENADDQDDAESRVLVHEATTPNKAGVGIWFRKCGGGRQVMRKQRGGY